MSKKYNDNQIFELYSKGLTDREIAEIVECTSNKLFQTILLKYNECDSMSYKLGLNSRRKTPLNRESPIKGNPVLNPQEIGENAERLTVMPNEKDEAIKSDTKAGHCSEMS